MPRDPIPIRCDQTGEVFSSLKEAAESLGLDRAALSKHVSGETYYTHVQGYTFTKLSKSDSLETKPMMRSRKIRVRCDQTGEVFDSLTEAARRLSLDPGTISRHIKGHPWNRSVGGYTFTRLPTEHNTST